MCSSDLWQGPYRIAQVVNSNTVRLFNPATKAPDTTPINVSVLKHYIEYEGREENREEEENVTNENEEEDEDTYEIDRILSHRTKNGKLQYRVKSRNYKAQHNSWVDASMLNADELLQEYQREQAMAEQLENTAKSTKNSNNKSNTNSELPTQPQNQPKATRQSTRIRQASKRRWGREV